MFIQNGNNNVYLEFDIEKIKKDLEPAIYKLKVGENLFFEKVDFKTQKLLGKEHNRIKDKVIKRESSALFVGKSGFGKTLLTKHIAKEMSKKYPVIIIDRIEVSLLKEVAQIFDKVVFLFDEFEKNFLNLENPEDFDSKDYDYSQQALLSFFDGMAKKHIFLLTANEKRKISEYIFNRPGRIRYMFMFEELKEDIFYEYNFNEKEIELLKHINNTYKFSFDILTYLKEEKEAGFSIEEALKDIGFNFEIFELLQKKAVKIKDNRISKDNVFEVKKVSQNLKTNDIEVEHKAGGYTEIYFMYPPFNILRENDYFILKNDRFELYLLDK